MRPGIRMFFASGGGAPPGPTPVTDPWDIDLDQITGPVATAWPKDSTAPNSNTAFLPLSIQVLPNGMLAFASNEQSRSYVLEFDSGHPFEVEHIKTTPFDYRSNNNLRCTVFKPDGLSGNVMFNLSPGFYEMTGITDKYKISQSTMSTPVSPPNNGEADSFCFSSDGYYLYYKTSSGTNGKYLHYAKMSTPWDWSTHGEITDVDLDAITGETSTRRRDFIVSPDGRFIYAVSGYGDFTLWKLRLSTPFEASTAERVQKRTLFSSNWEVFAFAVNDAATKLIAVNLNAVGSGQTRGWHEFNITHNPPPPPPANNWDNFDFTGLTSMTPVKKGFTLKSPINGASATNMRLSYVSDGRIVVSGSAGYVFTAVYDFDEGHSFELDHLIPAPKSYAQGFVPGLSNGLTLFAPDGSFAYMYSDTGNSGETKFSFQVPYDLATAEPASAWNFNGLGGLPSFAGFSADGMSCYVHAEDSPDFYQRLLVNPYDNVTKPYRGIKSVNFYTLTGEPPTITWRGICMSPDGRYLVCTTGDGKGKAWKFRMTTPWDIETMEFIGWGLMQDRYLYPKSCLINSSGTKMLIATFGSYAESPGIWEYDLTALR